MQEGVSSLTTISGAAISADAKDFYRQVPAAASSAAVAVGSAVLPVATCPPAPGHQARRCRRSRRGPRAPRSGFLEAALARPCESSGYSEISEVEESAPIGAGAARRRRQRPCVFVPSTSRTVWPASSAVDECRRRSASDKRGPPVRKRLRLLRDRATSSCISFAHTLAASEVVVVASPKRSRTSSSRFPKSGGGRAPPSDRSGRAAGPVFAIR